MPDVTMPADTLVVRRVGVADGEPQTIGVRISRQAGDLGRISVKEFFGADKTFGIRGAPMFAAPVDCHQRQRPVGAGSDAVQTIAVYTAIVGAMATAREAIYRHARKVSQFGHGTALQSKDPVTVATAVAVVAVAVSIIGLIVGGVAAGTAGTTIRPGSLASIGFSISGVATAAWIAIIILLGVGLIAA